MKLHIIFQIQAQALLRMTCHICDQNCHWLKINIDEFELLI